MAFLKYRWGMTALLIVSIVAVVSVLIALMTYSDIRREQSLSRDGFKKRAEFLTAGLNDVLANHIYFSDIDALRKLTEVIQSEPDISYVHVFSPEGRFLVRTSRLDEGSRYSTDFVVDEVGLSAARDGRADFRFDGNGLDATIPIFVDEDVFGVMQLGFSGEALSSEIREIVLQHLWQGLLLIGLGVIAAYLIARYITRPLQDLAAAAARIGAGELDSPVPVGGTREVWVLAEALESMRTELRGCYDGLENNVRERTKELEEAYRELQTLDLMKDEFISTVSNELRTPLRSIKGAAEILLRYKDEDPDIQEQFLEIIDKESDRLTRLINDVLDLARIEAGEMGPQPTWMDLSGVISTAVDNTRSIALEKNVTIETGGMFEVPPFESDQDGLILVIMNLLSNAIKFTPAGGLIRVDSRMLANGDPDTGVAMAEIRVADSGVGIPGAELHKIFDRFWQVGSSTNDRPQGSGLGLAISKGIVERLGGEIWVESELGKGSTFLFTVPVEGSMKQAPAALDD